MPAKLDHFLDLSENDKRESRPSLFRLETWAKTVKIVQAIHCMAFTGCSQFDAATVLSDVCAPTRLGLARIGG